MFASAGTASGQTKRNQGCKKFYQGKLWSSGNLYINIGPEFKVVLEGDKDDLEEIETEVSGGKLVIKKDNWRFNMNEKITAYVTMPELKDWVFPDQEKLRSEML